MSEYKNIQSNSPANSPANSSAQSPADFPAKSPANSSAQSTAFVPAQDFAKASASNSAFNFASNSAKRLFSIILALFIFSTSFIYSQDISKQERQKQRLEKDIAILDSQLKANKAKSNTALADLSLIRKKIAMRKSLIEESDKEIKKIASEIYSKQLRINELNRKIDTLSTYYSKLLRNVYKNRDAKVWYMYIIASDNLSQAMRRASYLKRISDIMNDQCLKIQDAKDELEGQKAALNQLHTNARRVKNQRMVDLKTLKNEEDQARNLVNTLKRNQSSYTRQISQKRRQVVALNKEIEKIIRNAMSKKDKKTNKEVKIDYKLDKQFASNKGKLPWPAVGPITEHFGQRYHPVFKRLKLPFNNGITISLNKGESVRSIFSGEVKQIVVMPGYNKCVLVRHGNYFTFYCKLSEVFVKSGDKINLGDIIGVVDTINGETQLHFQIWEGKTPRNPEQWLRKK